MKLYTEEQVRKAIELAQECEHECGGVYFDYTETEIIETLTPIELPSDELIEIEASYTYRLYPNNQKEHPEYKYGEDINAPRKRKAFIKGAKWLRDKILNQNK